MFQPVVPEISKFRQEQIARKTQVAWMYRKSESIEVVPASPIKNPKGWQNSLYKSNWAT